MAAPVARVVVARRAAEPEADAPRAFARDGWRCTVPGCSSYANLHAHHVCFRSAGGGDALANPTTLCAAHHLRGVHAPGRDGRIRIHGEAPGRLRFEMPLGCWTSGDVRAFPSRAPGEIRGSEPPLICRS